MSSFVWQGISSSFSSYKVSYLSEMRKLQLQLVCIYVCLTHYIKGILPDVCYGYLPYESLTTLYHAPWLMGSEGCVAIGMKIII